MSVPRRVMGWALILGVLGAVFAAFHFTRAKKTTPLLLRGAVIRLDSDVRKQLPVAEVEISAVGGRSTASVKSDTLGYWSLPLAEDRDNPDPGVKLRFLHPDYEPLELQGAFGDRLVVARLVPIRREAQPKPVGPEVIVAKVIARYSTKSVTEVNVGSAVKSFEAVNTGNIPCDRQGPCSPDGKWKATVVKTSLHAEEGNVFRNARVSCVAGPCPFTQVERDVMLRDGRDIEVVVRNWSYTATFLLEAEVIHPMISDLVRVSYPAIFGRTLNFTLPAAAEGVSIQAELNNETIVFPLGPKLLLSWADCSARANPDQTRFFRCELKPGFRFHSSNEN